MIYKSFSGCRVVGIWDGTSPATAFLHSPIRLRLRRTLGRFLDAVITNCHAGERYLRDILRIPESKIVRHPYQVPEPDALCSSKDGENPFKLNSRPVFLFVGSLITRKGWRYLLETAAQLVQRGMNSFSVVLAGDGEQRQDLLRMVASLRLEIIVHLMGQLRYEDPGVFFLASDVFVLPTLEDVWAVVVLEAMAVGRPVICLDLGGPALQVTEQTGIKIPAICPSQAIAGLSLAMEELARDPTPRARLGQAGRERVSRLYNWEEKGKYLADLYDQAVSEKLQGTSGRFGPKRS